jgi:hypothetical protein
VNVKQRTGSVYMYVCMLMHMCVRERERERGVVIGVVFDQNVKVTISAAL